MTGPGSLDRRLTLEQPVETPDGSGGIVRAYESAGLLWAAVTPLSAREAADAAALGVAVTHRIRMRMRGDISNRHRLRLGARVFRIVSWRDADGRGRFLDIAAEERAD